ncbi:hypothetical protein Trydic_g21197 [Trypoxylus dichotomus]
MSKTFSYSEELVLAKGLNYAIFPKSNPKEGTIAEVESFMCGLPSVIADQIRFEITKYLILEKTSSFESDAWRNQNPEKYLAKS